MVNLKVRIYDSCNDTIDYLGDMYHFEGQYIRNLDDLRDDEIPMICSNLPDNGGSEIWEGDTMTNEYVTVEIEYNEAKAAFMGKYTHMEDQYEYLWKLIKMGFLRSGNRYCAEH